METRSNYMGSSSLKINEKVIATIAKMAACEVDGVSGITGDRGGIAGFFNKSRLTQYIKINLNDNVGVIDIHIDVKYGAKVPTVAEGVQVKVKEAVQNMTGMAVSRVNVYVTGVVFSEQE